MNWNEEGRLSWTYLQWMREVDAENQDAGLTLPHFIHGMDEWNNAIARDRHSTGDPDRISPREYFMYATSMMSRAAKEAIDGALKSAMLWEVDNPMAWPSENRAEFLAEAKGYWEAAHHVITNTLAAWITLWNDLAALQDQMSAPSQQELLQQWQTLADQASETIAGLAVAFWAQSSR